jgi:uncharacterized protein
MGASLGHHHFGENPIIFISARPRMKKLLSVIIFFLVASLQTIEAKTHWPQPTGYVNDFAHVISLDQAQQIESLLSQLEQETGAQVAVVTVDSVEEGDIDGAAVDLFKAWGIGKKGKDNGVLILAAIKDRKGRIEVGYGLEAVITDGQAGSILRQDIFPFFKQQDYGQGLLKGARHVAILIAPNVGGTSGSQANGQEKEGSQDSALGMEKVVNFIILLSIFFVCVVLISFLLFWESEHGRGWGSGGGWSGGGWGGGGGSGGGGFGGFGGGGSGGGGASGGW